MSPWLDGAQLVLQAEVRQTQHAAAQSPLLELELVSSRNYLCVPVQRKFGSQGLK